jgi:hypothetical protein
MSSIGAPVFRSKCLTASASTRQAKRVISSDERKQQENGTKYWSKNVARARQELIGDILARSISDEQRPLPDHPPLKDPTISSISSTSL